MNMTLFTPFDQSAVLRLSEIVDQYALLRQVFIVLALAGVYLIPLIWVFVWFYRSNFRLSLLSSIAAGAFAWWGINNLIQLFYFQNRPVHELPVREWFFERPENSFPSDHVAFLAGIAFFFLFQKQQKVAALLFLLCLLVGFARVAVAVHYPSDVVFGVVTGYLAGLILHWFHPWLSQKVWPSLIRLAHRLKLG
jgi:undecaprenyl-diphosphatase